MGEKQGHGMAKEEAKREGSRRSGPRRGKLCLGMKNGERGIRHQRGNSLENRPELNYFKGEN